MPLQATFRRKSHSNSANSSYKSNASINNVLADTKKDLPFFFKIMVRKWQIWYFKEAWTGGMVGRCWGVTSQKKISRKCLKLPVSVNLRIISPSLVQLGTTVEDGKYVERQSNVMTDSQCDFCKNSRKDMKIQLSKRKSKRLQQLKIQNRSMFFT